MLNRFGLKDLHSTTAPLPARSGIAALFLFALAALGLGLMGRPTICECGEIKLWAGEVYSQQMSQQVSDWYSFTHIEHGLLFYFLGWLLLPGISITRRFFIALTIEAAWEILENAPWFVHFYRKQALAIGYTGDSILNSLSDMGFMALGYFIAATAPVWASVALALSIESFLIFSIRDALILNILNFIYPLDFIARWQSGAR